MIRFTKNIVVFTLGVLLLGGVVLAKEYLVGESGEPDVALLRALKNNNLTKFEKLLKSGANPNIVFSREDWVMGLATQTNKLAFLKLAIAHGGEVDLINPYDSSNRPISHALLNGNDEAVKYLVEIGADLNLRDCPKCAEDLQYSPVISAAAFNEYALVYYMIEKKGGLTPLEIKQLSLKIENELIDINSDANQWRMKVVEYLRARGHEVTPKIRSRFEKTLAE